MSEDIYAAHTFMPIIEPRLAPIKMAVAINENILLENLEKVDVFKFSQRISVGSGALSSFQNLLLSIQHPQNNLCILLKKLPLLYRSRAA